MTDEKDQNPYEAPAAPKVERVGLGPWLTGLLVLMVAGNLLSAGFMLFAPDSARAADPLAPAWSFVARALFSLVLATTAAAMLLRRRAGLYAYYLLIVISIPLNLSRGLSFGKTLISAAAPAALMAILVRQRSGAFTRR
jgi:uncharacterized membrane protein YoaK (UPF0700 family)